MNTPGNPSGKRTPATKAAQNAAHSDAISTPTHPPAGGTPSTGATDPTNAPNLPNDLPDDLRLVVDAWPHLPPAIRAGVLAMVKAAASTRDAGGGES